MTRLAGAGRALCVAAFVTAALLLVPSSAVANVRYAGHVRYTSTECCGFQEAAFKVFGRSNVHYRVCVTRPDASRRCKSRRTRDSGVPSHVTFLSNQVGQYTVVWKVSGEVRDTAHYVVNTESV